MPAGYVRIGYARASTVRQSLDTQVDSLWASGVTRVFSENVSTRAATRPSSTGPSPWPGRSARPGPRSRSWCTSTGGSAAASSSQRWPSSCGPSARPGVPGRGAAGLALPGPGGAFTVLAALSGMEREYIRDRTLEGHESARVRGKAIGGAAVTDGAMLAVALHLRGQELSLRDLAARLVISQRQEERPHPPPPRRP